MAWSDALLWLLSLGDSLTYADALLLDDVEREEDDNNDDRD